jgi:formylglycine-generating enzyme required for sulfatase activity
MAITAHVCDALAYAHERGIIHRDIKPANIMVGYDGVVKVADFGLAKVSASGGETLGLTQSGMAMGTLHFMAPEALMLGSAVDHRADIYAVGVMLYQMLTGKLPHGMFELPSIQVNGLDPRYDGIIAKAMREDRALRYQSAREMRHDLDGILTQPVQQVEMEPTRLQATLPEEARPRRSPAGKAQPHRPPQLSTPVPVKKKSSAGMVLLTLGLLGAIGAAMFFLGQDRKVPAGVKAPSTVGWPAATAATATTELASATKDAPFVNSLGMKFVPVPITGGPTDKQRVLFSVWETRVQDYEMFVTEMSRKWDKPRFDQGATHPAVYVSWDDAQAFCAWLTERERKAGKLATSAAYRLPSDHEWSCAVGIGDHEDASKLPSEKTMKISNVFPWETQFPPPVGAGNYAGEELRLALAAGKYLPLKDHIAGYRDDFMETAPVGSFPANRFGLYDLGGNVCEWCEDWVDQEQKVRVLRGASWRDASRGFLKSSCRDRHAPSTRFGHEGGFRCVLAPVVTSEDRAVGPSAAAGGPSVANLSNAALGGPSALPSDTSPNSATKDKPFTNTLGMKFVPVPGTKVLMCIHETRRQDYRVYADTVPGTDATWKAPVVDGKPLVQGEDHPVVHVSWDDATAFCQWLGKKEWLTYRLPTEHEWNLAVAIGVENPREISPEELTQKITDIYPWPTPFLPVSIKQDGADRQRLRDEYKQEHFKAQAEGIKHGNYRGSEDGYEGTAPVMSFLPNHLGIHDLGGNVWEWCIVATASEQASPFLRGCGFRNFGWFIVSDTRSGPVERSLRIFPSPDGSKREFGFRCVVELPKKP